MITELEFEKYWSEWSKKEESNYKSIRQKSGKVTKKYLKKGYTHFDNKFWFPEQKGELRQILKNRLKFYNSNTNNRREEWWGFSPFLKILVKTPRYKFQNEEGNYDLETKIRPISFASHFDSLIFGFYAYMLTKKYEEYIEENGFSEFPIAYRSNLDGKCNIQFAKEIFDEVKKRGNCSAIALDIKGYFDNINHVKLKEKWIKVIGDNLPPDQFKLYKALTEYSYVNRNSILKKYGINLEKFKKDNIYIANLLQLIPEKKDNEKFQRLRNDKLIVTNSKPKYEPEKRKGIPQGSGMSSVLSNIYLIDFDKDLSKRAQNGEFFYRRYCDDIVIICESPKAENLKNEIIEKIDKECLLEIQDKKVELTEFRPNSAGIIRAFNKKKQHELGITHTDEKNEKLFYKSIQYLGFEFNGQDIHIRASSLSRYFRKMKGRIIKTVLMAYSDNSKSNSIWKKQIFEKYSHLGNRNFLTYAYNASKEFYKNSNGVQKEGMNSPAIKRQLSRHFTILQNTLNSKNNQRFNYKEYKGKAKLKKDI